MKNKSDGKLLHIMMREMMLFIVISLLIMAIIVMVFVYSNFISKQKFFYEPYSSNTSIFTSGQYEQLDIEKEYGKGSHFYIFDDSFHPIYQSNPETVYPYTYEDTLLIPDELDDIATSWVIGENKERLFKIEYFNTENDIKTMVMVDASRNVIYSNMGLSGKLSEESLECIYGITGDYEMIKQKFMHNGKSYIGVFMFPLSLQSTNLNDLIFIVLAVIVIILIITMLSMYLYIRRFNRKVIEPVTILSRQMEAFEVDREISLHEYEGPKEFVAIFDRFHTMGERLQSAQETNRKMIADISHDLKTPISVVQLYAKIVKEESISEEERQMMLATMVDKTHEMSELINLFSDYSKMYHSDFSLDLQRLDMVEYTRDYFIGKYNELELLGFELAIELPDSPTYLAIDPMNFKRVYHNIIGNSMKYNPQGTRIRVCLKVEKNKLVIILGDEGVGIDPAIKEKVFEAFIIGDQARTTGSGTGLGMAIIKKMVNLHHGSIRLLSEDETDLSVAIEIQLPILED